MNKHLKQKGKLLGRGLLTMLALAGIAALGQQPSFLARRDYFGINSPSAILLGDFNSDGIPDAVAEGQTISALCVFFGNGDGTFRPGPCSSSLPFDQIFRVHAIDVNGDGRLDAVFSTANDGTILVALGNGDGTFAPTFQLPGIVKAEDFDVADVNGDGILDIAVAGYSDVVQVAFGNGDGTFQAPLNTTLKGPLTLAAVDLNRDGKADLVVNTTASTVVLLSKGDGTFSKVQHLPLPCYSLASSATGDFNGDGLADVALGCSMSPPNVYTPYVAILLNEGNGTVKVADVSPLTGVVLGIAVGDATGDGLLDAIAVGGLGTAYILPGLGNGKLAAAYSYPLGGGAGWIGVADLRSSGALDLISQNEAAYDWSVLLNNGHGRFTDGVTINPVQPGPQYWAASQDVNHDGYPDIAAATVVGVQLLFGTGKAASPFTPGPVLATRNYAEFVAFGDFNNDGNPDIVAATYNGNTLLWIINIFLGDGQGNFSLLASYPGGPSNRYLGPIVVADLNRDGALDVITTSGVMLGNGDGTLQAFTPFPTSNLFPYLVNYMPAVADFNGDGIPDVATFQDHPSDFDAGLVILLGKGDGTFQPPLLPEYAGAFAIAADFNHDGVPDLMLGSYDHSGFRLLLGRGDGTFRLASSVFLDPNLYTVETGTVADYNGDGHLDVVITDTDGFVAAVLLGSGDGTFSNATNPLYLGTGPYPVRILSGQFHTGATAGTQDLFTASSGGGFMLLPNVTRH